MTSRDVTAEHRYFVWDADSATKSATTHAQEDHGPKYSNTAFLCKNSTSMRPHCLPFIRHCVSQRHKYYRRISNI